MDKTYLIHYSLYTNFLICIQTNYMGEYMKIDDIMSLIKKSKAVYLGTISSEGTPEIRALLNLADEKTYPKLKDKAVTVEDETFTIYFTTNTSSRKTAQMRANPNIAFYYCLPEKFLGACLTGTVEEIQEIETKKSFWQTKWLMYYHKGVTDPDYALFKFTSKSAHCWGGLKLHDFGKEIAKENVEKF